ncbi:hypothetical protein LXD69_07130 [Flavobacterium sediminilitoris]|uniref:Uncharacterized protein n=1 Tax=Flavobacterium sediminilitoris TaxID=2024526 RepID=A0ABY4HRE5_9FLAO|nr:MULTISPECIES: hypothetical protein [Flavobacterium]UOX35283.1 hypothetical protein LXD69_07130 [Flavobacterium sediminilitoris]
MNIEGEKIKQLISNYGAARNYPEKSYVVMFCEDNNLNYKQWSAYISGTQNLGIKIIDILMDIFPDLDLNWLLKNNSNYVSEPTSNYKKTTHITNEMIYAKLEKIDKKLDLKNINQIFLNKSETQKKQ